MIFYAKRQRSSPRDRPEVSGDSTLSQRISCKAQRRCLEVSPSGYYAWETRQPGPRETENIRLVERMRQIHDDSVGVIGAPRMQEDLVAEGESVSLNRVARLMATSGLQGWPQKKRKRYGRSSLRPAGITNHLKRFFCPGT